MVNNLLIVFGKVLHSKQEFLLGSIGLLVLAHVVNELYIHVSFDSGQSLDEIGT